MFWAGFTYNLCFPYLLVANNTAQAHVGPRGWGCASWILICLEQGEGLITVHIACRTRWMVETWRWWVIRGLKLRQKETEQNKWGERLLQTSSTSFYNVLFFFSSEVGPEVQVTHALSLGKDLLREGKACLYGPSPTWPPLLRCSSACILPCKHECICMPSLWKASHSHSFLRPPEMTVLIISLLSLSLVKIIPAQ